MLTKMPVLCQSSQQRERFDRWLYFGGRDRHWFESAPAWWLAFLPVPAESPPHLSPLSGTSFSIRSAVGSPQESLLHFLCSCDFCFAEKYICLCLVLGKFVCFYLFLFILYLFLIGISANFILPISVYFYFFKSQFKWHSLRGLLTTYTWLNPFS